ncbi:hypothetical protein Acsp07_51820 [Actinomycetospora sp. NBRC 106378]|nr:hypothetical protein Acsp07_51820 [Actinomycetospora sp. NBRC 106378]
MDAPVGGVQEQRAAPEGLVVGVGDHDVQPGRHESPARKVLISRVIPAGTSNIGKWLRASRRTGENHGWVAA